MQDVCHPGPPLARLRPPLLHKKKRAPDCRRPCTTHLNGHGLDACTEIACDERTSTCKFPFIDAYLNFPRAHMRRRLPGLSPQPLTAKATPNRYQFSSCPNATLQPRRTGVLRRFAKKRRSEIRQGPVRPIVRVRASPPRNTHGSKERDWSRWQRAVLPARHPMRPHFPPRVRTDPLQLQKRLQTSQPAPPEHIVRSLQHGW
jgi:hypothetical protein